MGELGVNEKKAVLQHIFDQYDLERKGELSPIQVQILHGSIRIGGLSLAQVIAAIEYTCLGKVCQSSELFDLLQEMDRRYFLLQDLRWEFSLLDREQKDTITEEQARWLIQTVHGKYFSRWRWEHFLKSRPVPGSAVGFAEIEVLLCEVPSKTRMQEHDRLKQQEEEEKLSRKKEFEKALEREKMKKKEDQKHRQANKEKEEEERRRKREENEKAKRLEEEKERLRRDEDLKIKQKEEIDAEKLRQEAEKAEKDATDKLENLKKQKLGDKSKSKEELEAEEKKLNQAVTEHKNMRIRYQLKVAIKSRDKFQLEYSITEFRNADLSDDEMDLEKAMRLLKQITAKEGIHKAMSKREIEELERAITFVRTHGFESELSQELADASRLLGRLKRLERIRHEILELKQSTVAEIRSYTNPPPIVHSVMTAVFLLLGHREKETKDWKAVQSLVGKTGKENLKRRCLELKSDTLQLSLVKYCKTILDKFNLEDVRDISAGAATFYVWATATIEDVLEDGQE